MTWGLGVTVPWSKAGVAFFAASNGQESSKARCLVDLRADHAHRDHPVMGRRNGFQGPIYRLICAFKVFRV